MQTASRPSGSRHRDPLRAFYTNDDRLVDFMVQLLKLRKAADCLEPAAGDGCFVRGILRRNSSVNVEAWELSTEATRALRDAFSELDNVEIKHGNFLTSENEALFARTYDRVIANPPYGAWQDPTLRSQLKRLFPGLYVKETYGLFLAKSFAQLRQGGRLVFIVPETFLFIHRQQKLREELLRGGTISSIDIIPSSLFPGVSFGYARLSIIVIDRCPPRAEHRLVVRHSSSMDELTQHKGRSFEVAQASILHRHSCAFPIEGIDAHTMLVDSAAVRLGDLADCVTGFYSGCDGRFLRACSPTVKGASRYSALDHALLFDGDHTPLEGIGSRKCFVPILKGGGYRFLKPLTWAVDWSCSAVKHYRSDPKARFQNSRFYFKRGIGLPMVSSTKPNAAIIHAGWLFDQSIVGIFPKDPVHFWFLLVLLNSPTCFRLLRLLNPSANNSAKYVRELPVVLPRTEKELSTASRKAEAYVTKLASGASPDPAVEHSLNEFVAELYEVESRPTTSTLDPARRHPDGGSLTSLRLE
jgi:adenine-specific DNA-methyltransferase